MLKDIIKDRELYDYARSSAVRAYELLYWEDFISQEEIIEFYRALINDELVGDESYFATALVNSIIDLRLIQMIPEACFLYDKGCVETFVCGRYDNFIDEMYSDKNYRQDKPYVDDTISEMEWGACFKDEAKKKDSKHLKNFEKGMGDFIPEDVKKDMEQNQMVAQTLKKVGRNNPCPCGSGKKYKKCCYDNGEKRCGAVFR